MSDAKTCGDHGGKKRDGDPCQRPEGWGTDETTGPCSFHRLGAPKRSVKFDAYKRAQYIKLITAGGRRYASAAAVGVSYETTRTYRYDHPDFDEELSAAEMQADEAVENSLYQTALGGNTTACLAWLYSRCPERWRDMRNVKHAPEPEGNAMEKLARILGVKVEDLPD